MARKLKEIKSFFKGIFSSASSSDIDDEAASYSKNIDSATKDGKLTGAPKDGEFRKFGVSYGVNTDNASTIANQDGTVDLVFEDFDSFSSLIC